MTAITGPGYWRVTQDGTELLREDDGRQQLAVGSTTVVRVEDNGRGGLHGFQRSGAALALPDGQVLPNDTLTVLWNHE